MLPFRTVRPLARLPFLLGFLAFACTFAPSEEYFKEIEQVSAMAYIDLSTYNETDTILLDHPTTFNFNVDISNPSTLEQVEIILDSKPSFSSYTPRGDFTLSPLNIPPGLHQLTIQFKAKSNSGSLADNVGAEYFQVWKTWVLKVVKYDIDPPQVPDLKITETDGRLRLDWTPYTKKNFISYTLKLSFPQEHEIVFTDPLTTHWVDSSFLWGSATFALTVSNTFGTASNNTRIDEPQTLTVTYDATDTTASLKWK
ncbi:MAG TPA: hypothetical protein VK666_17760, partial [Chryseolinea sp.]|nr:hypothetical protein [Chryseolinea sp.]